ncbi:O-antigen ligase family protein [Phenylobacterium sp.]|uniref:O-antigen ligase family protein n=1 Tax=Phenylobacterium sp. TaxID=1871053 RepID=UPI002BFCDE35|nr:O-antigen ligase family protein [Phenylobacterium sp.]HLZ75558.1 O-antigen ligase family protein [Phenylobacterium sp.]
MLKPFAVRMSLPWRIAGRIAIVLLGIACVLYGFGYALTTPFLLKQFLAPLLPLACLTIWALPESATKPTRAVEDLFWAFYLGAMLWPGYLSVALPGLPWFSALRLLGLPMAIAMLVRLSTSTPFREQVVGTVRTIPYLGTFMAAFSAIQVFSVAVSDQPVTSLDSVIDNLIGWTAVFFVACYMFRRPGAAERWIAAFCICAVGLCFMGIWERRLEHVPWGTHVPSFFATGDDAVQRALTGTRRLGIGDYRVEGVESTSLGMAEFLALATPFLLHYIGGPFRTPIKIAAVLALPLVFVVILSTQARLGMVGFFLSVLLYLVVWGVNRWKSAKGSLLGPAIVLAYPAFFLAFVAASFTVQRLKTIVWGNGETAASNEGRMEQMQKGIPMIFKRPWGYGAGRGAEKLGYMTPGGTLTIDNYFLLVALDWGILGFIVYYGMILMVTWNAARYGWARTLRNREHSYLVPAGIALAEFFVIKSIFSQTHNHALTFMIMGMVAALIFRIRYGVPGDELPNLPPLQPPARPRSSLAN